jgi:dihydroorotate dehydrogenase (NAD+) catalytic subunit
VGTALFVDPAAPNKILDGLVDFLQRQGITSLAELIGALELPGDQPVTAPYP